MFFLIPFLVCQVSPKLFFSFQTVHLLARLIFLIKARRCYDKYEKVKEFSNKIIWILYHFSYLALWLARPDEDPQIVKYGSFGVVFSMLFGIICETVYSVIDLFLEIKELISKHFCKKNKINPEKTDNQG